MQNSYLYLNLYIIIKKILLLSIYFSNLIIIYAIFIKTIVIITFI